MTDFPSSPESVVLIGPTDTLRDQIAERIWRAEYRREIGKMRAIEWAEVGDNDVHKYLYLAEAILPLVSSHGCGTPGCTDPNCEYGKGDDAGAAALRSPGHAQRPAESEGVRWRRVNDEPYEYAIQQGQFGGDEFVKLLNGTCLRRALSNTSTDRPKPKWDNRPACSYPDMDDPVITSPERGSR